MVERQESLGWIRKCKPIGDLILLSVDTWNNFILEHKEHMNKTCENEQDIARLLCTMVTTTQKTFCQRVAIEDRITADGFRSPNVRIIYGSNGIVERKENGIKYSYDVTKCMFSKGNITEKIRLSKLNCLNEIIVDLFAGIGYFTLPLLVHAKAKHIHACEWNPSSIQSLRHNLLLNNVADRCTIHEGDNFRFHPHGIAQRVILGIFPSCFEWLKSAVECLDHSTGGVLHCHELVTITKDIIGGRVEAIDKKGQELSSAIKKLEKDLIVDIINVTRVKKYAPHIEHIVYDVKVNFFEQL